MLQIQHLTKQYGKKTAVSDLSLSIAPGEIYGFIGHNGAGKTTTLKACTGLIDFEGDIFVNQRSIKREPLKCKRIMAYLPDNPDLYDFLSGYEYLNFVADIYGVSALDRKTRTAELGERLGITDALTQPLAENSHGMKQKVALISAFLHKPKLILMDEPFVGLDPAASHQLKQLMAEHCAAGGSIFFSTHVLEVAEKLCHKIAIIKNGKLITAGKTEDIIGDASLEEVFLDLEVAEQ